MRIEIPHGKTQQEAISAVDRAVEDALRSLANGPVKIIESQKSWAGPMMNFSLTARMGLIKNRIVGTAQVTDTQVIVDADLGVLKALVPEDKVRAAIESRVRGLLA